MDVLSVSQVNTYIKALLDENAILRDIYISGEISNFTHYYRSGHMYFTLKDENSQLKAVMFSGYSSRLKFVPDNGMKVICRGRISLYEKNGEYQLYAQDMQPDGLGALNLAFEQLKEKLFSEGLFSEEIKKPIPKFPRKIGIATSNIGAAIEDIKNIAKRRYPLAELVICPTIVQGSAAPEDIVKSIELLDAYEGVDVIIVGRGGGSIEDLWAFNTEQVARAVASCKTPVVSAVGHETDVTICDFVADLRAPTPSAAAEIVCPDIESLMHNISSVKETICFYINNRVDSEFQRLDSLTENSPLSDIESFLKPYYEKISAMSEKISEFARQMTVEKENVFKTLAGKLDALSPLAVLGRGYSVVTKNNKVINCVSELKANDKICIRFEKGTAVCCVEEVTE